VAAVAAGSAASLGGITASGLGADTTSVEAPFTDGVKVTWGEAELVGDAYAVSEFSVSRNPPPGQDPPLIPFGRLGATLLGVDGQSLMEAAVTTSGAESSQLFVLPSPVAVEDIGRVSVAFTGRDSRSQYGIGANHIGSDPASVWLTGATDPAVVVLDDDLGVDVLRLSENGAFVRHDASTGYFAGIDNAYGARLGWRQFVMGGVSGEIDPDTQNPLENGNSMKVTARKDPGARIFLDLTIAYGGATGPLDETHVTCEIDADQQLRTLDLYECGREWRNPDDGLYYARWVSADGWVTPAHTYAPGDAISSSYAEPAVATVVEYGFRMERPAEQGWGSATISAFEVRSHRVGFAD
jgi:hypothetical protein